MALPDEPKLPLARLRVVDATSARAALASRLLADLGADVVRLEPARSDASAAGTSLGELIRNGNKRVVASGSLDAEVDRLLGKADLLFVSRDAPDVLPSPARDYLQRHPALVVVAISDFGESGPYRDYQATGAVMAGLGWMLSKAGDSAHPPVLPPASFADDIAAVMAAFAALTGLHDRLRSGVGQYIDFSAIEALQQTTDWALPNTVFRRSQGQLSSEVRSGGGEAQPIVTCKDGWVRLAVLTASEWRRLREWMGEPAELQDPAFDLLQNRVARWTEVEPHFMRLFADLTMIEASEEGQRRRVPTTPVLRATDVLEAVQYKALGTFGTGLVVDGRKGTVPTGFWSIDRVRAGLRHEPEQLGSLEQVQWRDATLISERTTDSGAPYGGVRVLDMGVAGVGPELARLLAEYGADVIRIESAHHPELTRQLGGAVGLSPTFISSNRCKRSFGVSLSDARGVALLRRLVGGADLILENMAPGALGRWGIDLDELRSENPNLITFSSQMMGDAGPWKDWRGYGANTQPPGGLTFLWSHPGLPAPSGTDIAFPDHVVGRLGALAVAACLVPPMRNARRIDVIQAEVAINLLAELYLQESLDPGSVQPIGNTSPQGAPWGVYQCQGEERWCVITCRGDADWGNLVAALGHPDWATPELQTVEHRRARAGEIDARLSEWTAQRTDAEAMRQLQMHGVPAGYVMYPSDVDTDPHLVARGYPVDMEQPHFGPVVLEGSAFRSERLPAPRLSPAPLLGEQTIEIATELLGLSADQIEELIADEVLFVAKNPVS